jgi:hypothetical protein
MKILTFALGVHTLALVVAKTMDIIGLHIIDLKGNKVGDLIREFLILRAIIKKVWYV